MVQYHNGPETHIIKAFPWVPYQRHTRPSTVRPLKEATDDLSGILSRPFGQPLFHHLIGCGAILQVFRGTAAFIVGGSEMHHHAFVPIVHGFTMTYSLTDTESGRWKARVCHW